MNKLHYHDIARRNINKIYAIDSNVLINLAKYYYKGHCHDETETKEIKELVWLAKSPNGSLEYENAIIETCFDYSRNMLDVNALNGFMLAIGRNVWVQHYRDKHLYLYLYAEKRED